MGDDRLVCELESNSGSTWVLLAEDDALFASLFSRFFKLRFPEVELLTARSLVSARETLRRKPRPPVFAVLDLNLEDGSARELEPELSCPFLTWSASPEGPLRAKPNGREALQAAVSEIGELALLGSLDLPSNRGSATGEKE